MLRRSLSAIFVLTCVVTGALTTSCGGAQHGRRHHGEEDGDEESERVNLGKWCKHLGKVVCERLAECAHAPDEVPSCKATFTEKCIAERDPKADAGRTHRELEKCEETYASASCDGYLDEVVSHTECRVRMH